MLFESLIMSHCSKGPLREAPQENPRDLENPKTRGPRDLTPRRSSICTPMRISSFYSRLLNKSEGTCAQGKILLDHFAVVRDPPAPVHVSDFSSGLLLPPSPALLDGFLAWHPVRVSSSFRSQGDQRTGAKKGKRERNKNIKLFEKGWPTYCADQM